MMSAPRPPRWRQATLPHRRWLPAVVLSGVVLLGCAPASEPVDDGVVETAHLRISNSTGNPICAGTPLLLEAELEPGFPATPYTIRIEELDP